jgi:isopentenyldiphosphate isomerase
MEKLRKQIRESFFNPVLHFLPLLIFLIVDEFSGMNLAWKISFPIALSLLIYVYFVYKRLFTWCLVFTLLFLTVSTIAYLELFFAIPLLFHNLGYEVVFLLFLLVSLVFRKKIQGGLSRIISKLIPMTNNFSELYRVVWKLFLLMLVYMLGNIILFYSGLANSPYQLLLKYVYLGLIVSLIIYEILRVQIIRTKLTREEWWPIVTDQGKIIGSIQHLTSLNDENKYMHPIVRVFMIDKGMVLLQKRSSESLFYPGLWDTAISNHVKMGETIEQCIDRTAEERYSMNNFKYMYLANYTLELEKENHYAFLFVSCQQADFKFNPTFTDQLKWWTQQQIEEDLETGIFTDNFKVEYDLLKRSGLLDTGKCECSCRLKEVIYQQSTVTKE